MNENKKKYKKMLEDLFNESLNSSKDLNNMDDFDQFDDFDFDLELDDNNLSEKEQHDVFYEFVEENNLKLELDIINDYDTLMVEENWVSDNELISLRRFYPYEIDVISKLNSDMQKKIFNHRLEQTIDEEEYEEAAEIRDLIKNIDK